MTFREKNNPLLLQLLLCTLLCAGSFLINFNFSFVFFITGLKYSIRLYISSFSIKKKMWDLWLWYNTSHYLVWLDFILQFIFWVLGFLFIIVNKSKVDELVLLHILDSIANIFLAILPFPTAVFSAIASSDFYQILIFFTFSRKIKAWIRYVSKSSSILQCF